MKYTHLVFLLHSQQRYYFGVKPQRLIPFFSEKLIGQ